MPVVAMNDVWRPFQSRQHVQHRFAEKAEPLGFIIEIVQAFAPKIVFVIDKVNRHAFMLHFKQAAVLTTPAQLNRFTGDQFHLIAEAFRYIAIQRNNNSGVDFHFF